MVSNEDSITALVSYIERNMKKGYKIEGLRWALINQKHSKSEIDKAIKIVEARTPSVKKEDERKEEIREATREQLIEPEEKRGFWSRLLG